MSAADFSAPPLRTLPHDGPANWSSDQPSEFGPAELGGAPDALVDLLAALRSATTHYAGMLRREGVRPERVLPEVKALVRDVMAVDSAGDPATVRVIEAQVVQWSLQAYYGAA